MLGACIALLASGCANSHNQETVTVAPRAAATQATSATMGTNSSSTPPAVDAETEAAGDALAHAIVALKTRRRDEALYYMNLARTGLTRRLNRSAVDANANSNSTRERLIKTCESEAERSVRTMLDKAGRNSYDQRRTRPSLLRVLITVKIIPKRSASGRACVGHS